MASVTWLGHSTALIELGRTKLLTDPVLRRRVAHLVRVADDAAIPAHVDAVLLSHLHRDHADVPTLRRLAAVPVIAAPGATRLLDGIGTGPVRELQPGDQTRVGDLTVRATPAEHDGRRHPLAASRQALGFLIEGSQRIYFAGDTDIFAAMGELADPQIDVALLPVWGWGSKLGPGHLDPVRAARAVALLAPRIVVPIHWGTYAPMTRGPRPVFRDEPARAFAALVGRESPAVEVVVLAPGETLELAAR
jgi:L-ascorbate metabolism protein UlaG (beta-lactamase superfamily)